MRTQFVSTELERRKADQRLRTLTPLTPQSAVEVEVAGQCMVNFSANDYLGLSKHPLLTQRAKEFADAYGVGATGSRLISGNFDYFAVIEDKLARLKKSESALILNSGFQGNMSIIPTLINTNSLILSDELNHSSIVQGVKLSGATKMIYGHNNLSHLQELLIQHRDKYERALIVTESVFSMDGDRSDIERLVALADRFDALLMVDEAHATGVLGEGGMGLTVGKGVDVVLGTFGKALGTFGAYICCSGELKDYFINCCPGFIYSTALPPPVLGAIDAALDLIPGQDAQRRYLHNIGDQLRVSLQGLGYETLNSSTQIIPVVTGGESATIDLSARLAARGLLATPIRPPTVPVGQSRIRIALSAAHTDQHLENLTNAFAAACDGT